LRAEQVVISLKKADGFYKCKDTVVSLESMLIEAIHDLQTIDAYIARWRDVRYWMQIKSDKLVMIDKLQITRKNILNNVSVFENNLVLQSVHYFIISITPYRVSLYQQLSVLSQSGASASSSHISLLKNQIDTIESLSKVETIAQLIPLLDKYIYFKKQLWWKFE